MKLDHIMYAARSLEEGVQAIEQQLSETAAAGGRHPGSGTHNALLSLGTDQYLEIIAPDPEQDPAGTMAEEMLQLESPRIRTWAAATSDFESIKSAAEASGFSTHEIEMSRARPDGVLLAWRLLFVNNHPFGLSLPFFIDWQDSPHPALDSPGESRLDHFEVSCPDPEAFHAFCQQIKLYVAVSEGDVGFVARIQTPTGEFTLS